ncbi:hypothetical protein TIFTF001_014454 [Ficus carica]|uniref:Uncharacterized protein n=1 Tax=Ficus carica TaxID=3494 RepID=A0AA88D5M1_FICCA|nr:hypothetical protein TIFTF001_014454 [Ficus carica]
MTAPLEPDLQQTRRPPWFPTTIHRRQAGVRRDSGDAISDQNGCRSNPSAATAQIGNSPPSVVILVRLRRGFVLATDAILVTASLAISSRPPSPSHPDRRQDLVPASVGGERCGGEVAGGGHRGYEF